jgi:hypothetical protein
MSLFLNYFFIFPTRLPELFPVLTEDRKLVAAQSLDTIIQDINRLRERDYIPELRKILDYKTNTTMSTGFE